MGLFSFLGIGKLSSEPPQEKAAKKAFERLASTLKSKSKNMPNFEVIKEINSGMYESSQRYNIMIIDKIIASGGWDEYYGGRLIGQITIPVRERDLANPDIVNREIHVHWGPNRQIIQEIDDYYPLNQIDNVDKLMAYSMISYKQSGRNSVIEAVGKKQLV
jgi:hypothetical protein